MESRRRLARPARLILAAVRPILGSDAIVDLAHWTPKRRRFQAGGCRAIASFRQSRAVYSAFARFVCRPKYRVADGLRRRLAGPFLNIRRRSPPAAPII